MEIKINFSMYACHWIRGQAAAFNVIECEHCIFITQNQGIKQIPEAVLPLPEDQTAALTCETIGS